jgi:hypothetical protein
MTDETTALARTPEVPMVPMPVMSEAEIQRTWRVAKALAASRFFKDARQAEAAFAKILLGRDLGLSPTEAMSALHVFDGKVEASADFHATRVKKSDVYDYSVAFEFEDDEVQACAITFYGPQRGEPWAELGVSRFSLIDAERAGLLKKDNWKNYPRNMLFARAMSNGVAWFCPEVMGGQRVYAPGEAQDFVDAHTIGGAADDDVAGPLHEDETLAERAEAVVTRAEELGHAGFANRGATAMALRGQSRERVEEWLALAAAELDKIAGEVEDATVVEDGDDGEPVPADDPEGEDERDAASTAAAGSGDATQGALEVE